MNPLASLTEQWRFVLAHEMLHAALRHGDRVGARDPYLWNVAADYVINGWLSRDGRGRHAGRDAVRPCTGRAVRREVYDLIATDLRRLRKLGHAARPRAGRRARRAVAVARVRPAPAWTSTSSTGGRCSPGWRTTSGTGADTCRPAWWRRSGYWTSRRCRGTPNWPAGSTSTSRHRSGERSYARPSRRQASTPHIPRPGWRWPEERASRYTFGVVLDTSGSMDHELLGKALGAIASYATARDVPAARVVFCDAYPYDAGYLPVADIAGRVRVRGRGGTVLQPGIDLLERADDFPATAPILVITDGQCDVVRVRREHAFLMPAGARLPFTPRGPVFPVR